MNPIHNTPIASSSASGVQATNSVGSGSQSGDSIVDVEQQMPLLTPPTSPPPVATTAMNPAGQALQNATIQGEENAIDQLNQTADQQPQTQERSQIRRFGEAFLQNVRNLDSVMEYADGIAVGTFGGGVTGLVTSLLVDPPADFYVHGRNWAAAGAGAVLAGVASTAAAGAAGAVRQMRIEDAAEARTAARLAELSELRQPHLLNIQDIENFRDIDTVLEENPDARSGISFEPLERGTDYVQVGQNFYTYGELEQWINTQLTQNRDAEIRNPADNLPLADFTITLVTTQERYDAMHPPAEPDVDADIPPGLNQV